MKRVFKTILTMMIVTLALLPWYANAQQSNEPTFSNQEIEQLVAPIALYPDPLVAQILMASTYPLEVVSAARWVEANPNLKGKALEDALQQQTWDPSVKSLTAVPQVLDMLNKKLDSTEKLGDAFLAQQKDVLDAIQRLRAKAQEKDHLNSSKEQTVKTTQQDGNSVISILPAEPDVIYVPTYDPNIVYGTWPYPSYPPYYYYPPGYELGAALLTFGAGWAVGNAIWGHCDWRHGNVNIDVNRYNSFNRTNINDANWHHDVAHRQGVEYRDHATQLKYGQDQLKGMESREAFRKKAEQGQKELKRNQGALKDNSPALGNQKAHKKADAAKKSANKPNQHRAQQQHKRPANTQGSGHHRQAEHRARTRQHAGGSHQRAANRGGHGGQRHRGGGGRRR